VKAFLKIFLVIILTLSASNFVADKIPEKKKVAYGERILPRSTLLKFLALEFRETVADLLWLQVTQIYGEKDFPKRAKPEDWQYLYRLTSMVVELDPYFFIPYYFTAFIFPWQAGMVKEANRLLKRGMFYRTWDWRLPFYIGFNLYFFLGDNDKASRYIMRASRLPEAPQYLPQLASRLLYEAGRLESALMLLEEIYSSTEDKLFKEEVLRRIVALRDILFLQRAVDFYEKKFGEKPSSLEDLVKRGIIKKIPEEPYGGRYYIDEAGRVMSTSQLRFKERNYGF
jgi:tetratricopeptide (TPR) repeat protein